MTFDEFWKTYHREDPDEALAHPHKLTIHLKNGKKHICYFPGSMLATPSLLWIGTPIRRDGTHKSSNPVPWTEIDRIIPAIGKRSSQFHEPVGA
jgi:hypothetical protein